MNPTEEMTYRDGIRRSLDEILMQTKKTNGRVSKLEQWQSYVLGAVATLGFLIVAVAVPLIIHLIGSGKL
jgi:hypothetical protein